MINYFDDFCKMLQDDPAYAWTWHCNLAMMAYDAGADHASANERAADFMRRVFGIDIREFDEWRCVMEVRK